MSIALIIALSIIATVFVAYLGLVAFATWIDRQYAGRTVTFDAPDMNNPQTRAIMEVINKVNTQA